MTRDELKDAISALGKRAGQSGHNIIAACLIFLVGAIVEGNDQQVADILHARFRAHEATKLN